MGSRSRGSSGGARLGVDVGGTFTDLVLLFEASLTTTKVPSTPRDQSAGVLAAIESAAIDASGLAAFAHGTTVATNALLERRGARTALVTTAGFRDVIEIGRQNRPSLYDLRANRPAPLVPRELRFTVTERMGPAGVVVPLDDASLAGVVTAIAAADVEAVAVCLLFGFLYPEHEQRVGAALRARLPGVHVSLSSEVLPEFREYERMATTTADAYLAPRLAGYLAGLAATAADAGLPPMLTMQSSGGVIDAAAAGAVRLVLSGPAAGVVGAAHVASLSGFADVLTFDMGGTSTDVAPVVAGRAATTTESVVAGVPIRLPMVDVHSVSAGGGSIGWVDEGGALRVGPRSAGAEPGPAAYDLGGTEPTVTDAHLFLGHLSDGAQLGGRLVLRRNLAEQALARLGGRLGMSAEQVAAGIIAVADAEMVRALRVISVERGLDPREFALLAFGGAGGLHACALAEELSMTRVLVPRASGVLSALGLAISDLRRDYLRPLLADVADLDPVRLESAFTELSTVAVDELHKPVLTRQADLRYRGQSFELTVPGGGDLVAAFHAEHERRYGYRMDDEPVQVVSVRVVATVPGELPSLAEPAPPQDAPQPGRRRAYLAGGWTEIEVFQRAALGCGSTVSGPAIVEFAEATCLIGPSWRGGIDAAGTLVLETS
ncbi:MAG: hydantoinase/oxoprolinase family protein [Gemmatimonadota bacterium]